MPHSSRSWAKSASNSLPLSDSTVVERWGSRDRPCSRARAVYRACLEGSLTAKAKCETGSMKVTM
jgi:hypothetical protein